MKLSISLMCLVYSRLAWAAAKSKQCLKDSDVGVYVQAYKDILGKVEGWEKIAEKHLHKDLVAYSDSDSCQWQKALNETHYTSRQAYIDHIEPLPPCHFHDIVITHNCQTITAYQRFGPSDMKYPVTSISIWFVDTAQKKVVKAFWEYNSGLAMWMAGKPECQTGFEVSLGGGGPGLLEAGCK